MPSYAYARSARTVDRMIRQYGYHETTPGKVFLRRDSGDRICRAIEISFLPREVDGNVIQRTDRRFILSSRTTAGPLFPVPDNEVDTLVLKDVPTEESSEVELIMPTKPRRLAPAGIMIYWDVHVRSK